MRKFKPCLITCFSKTRGRKRFKKNNCATKILPALIENEVTV